MDNIIKKISFVIDCLTSLFLIPASLTTLFLIAIIICDVIARNVFVVGFLDTVTLGSTGLLIVVFWGAATCLKEDKHIIMSAVQEHCGTKLRNILKISASTITLLILLTLSYFSWIIAWNSYSMNWKLVSPIALPIGFLQGIIASGFSLLALQQVSNLIKEYLFQKKQC